MRTETITKEIFSFDELSDEAKEKARDWWRDGGLDDVWCRERQDSYYAAEKIYKDLHNIDGEISGSRLYAWIQNNLSHIWTEICVFSKHEDGGFKSNWWDYKYDCVKYRNSRIKRVNNIEGCPLTGVCYDYDFLQPIIEFMKCPSKDTSNEDLELPNYKDVAQRDIDWMNSDEYIDETIICNEYEFLEDGTRY